MSEIPDLPPALERLLRPGFHEQIGAYALGSLPADERIAFEAHLRDCDACRAELPVLQEAALVLRRAIVPDQEPAPAPSAAPPPPQPVEDPQEETAIEGQQETGPATDDSQPDQNDLAGPAQLEQDDHSQEHSAEPSTARHEDAFGAGEIPSSTEGPSGEPLKSEIFADLPPVDQEIIDELAAPVEESAKKRRRPRGKPASIPAPEPVRAVHAAPALSSKVPWIAGGLGIVIGIVAIVAALALAETKGNLEEEISFQNAQIDELNAQRDAYLQQTTAITWTLEPTTLGTPDSGGIIFADPAGTSALLSVFGLPPLGSDQMYQVWYVRPDDSSVLGPSLTLDSAGNALVNLQPDLSPFKAIAITVEPASGNELPSTNPVLQGFFSTA
ncbi:MAG: anti-sigma factor [Thermomicrobiales bacterium]